MESEYYKLIPNKTKKKLNDEFDFEVNYNGKTKELAIFELCQEFNLFFDCNLAKNSRGLGNYIKHITLLPQYENKKFGDGIIKEKEMELNLLDALRNEQQMLLQKMKENMENGNIGTYKNLIIALKEITHLIHEEEWTQKWSKYSCDDKDCVAVWEQKGSEIKNHKIFEIKSYKN